ncbi:PIN domain-containing protein [Georgenia yuyongxinii]
MIVLDTNVVSELMRDRPDERVVTWADAMPSGRLYLTSVTTAELLYGVEKMALGARRAALGAAVADLITVEFDGRVLPFDVQSSPAYARLVADRERRGHPIGMADAMIAAIALAAGADMLATRNTKDFEGVGLDVIDPWGTRT